MQDFKFIWNIENFNYCPLQRGESLKSPPCNEDVLGSAYLELYPKGDILEYKDQYVVVCLNNYMKRPNVTVTCEVQVITYDESGNPSLTFKTETIHDEFKWGLIRENDPDNEYVEFLKKFSDRQLAKSTLTVTYNFSQNQTGSLENSKDMKTLSKDMENLYVQQHFSDIILKVGEEKFPAHKAILLARLPKLVANIESHDVHREISGMEAPVLKLLLDYAYSGKISAMDSNIPRGLYEAARRLELTDLKQKLFAYPNEVTARTCIKVDRNVVPFSLPDMKRMEVDKRVYFPAFAGGDIPGSDLKMSYCLSQGSSTDKRCQQCEHIHLEISIQRLCPDRNNPLYVQCKVRVCRPPGSYVKDYEHVFLDDEEWHLPHFVCIDRKASQIMNRRIPESGDHPIPVKCEVTIARCKQTEIEETVCSSVEIDDFARRGEDVQSLCSDLRQLYNIYLPKLTDVTLLIGDLKFPAHRAILSARSPVFTKMFSIDMLENNSGVVKITDIDHATLNLMLTYIYSAKVEMMNYENAVKLFTAADKYQIASLKDKCSKYLRDHLSTDNACQVLELADMHGDVVLKGCAKNYICAHSEVILESSGWKKLMEIHLGLVSEIMHNLVTAVNEHKEQCSLCT